MIPPGNGSGVGTGARAPFSACRAGRSLRHVVLLLGLLAALLSGCQPRVYLLEYNNTGLPVEVFEGDRSITVADGSPIGISYVPKPNNPLERGLSVKIAGRKYFYTFSRKGYELNSPPYEYWRHVGFNSLEKDYGLSRSGEIYALEPGTTSYRRNRQPQPTGFPVKPEA